MELAQYECSQPCAHPKHYAAAVKSGGGDKEEIDGGGDKVEIDGGGETHLYDDLGDGLEDKLHSKVFHLHPGNTASQPRHEISWIIKPALAPSNARELTQQ